ncbi:hypothetical protein APHMUC_1346 [Anaplasma phagocytophilum str. ApMUC09]|uniref:Uncharacterized protein n=1 Tax=Anaplasma phagocytophilum str. ApMUC09 TaxID=1359152 RepID=A0A0F3N6I9_ANAPH|nr:hypothetical protein APHMUC_1346 [Anaplasma phagocytophilum str. ApMUC09]
MLLRCVLAFYLAYSKLHFRVFEIKNLNGYSVSSKPLLQ